MVLAKIEAEKWEKTPDEAQWLFMKTLALVYRDHYCEACTEIKVEVVKVDNWYIFSGECFTPPQRWKLPPKEKQKI